MLMLTRALIVVAGAAFFGGVPVLLTTYEDEASQVPARWALDYRGLSIGQIVNLIGPPQEDVSYKQFMNWTLEGQDGTRVLRVSCQVNCSEGERPASVTYEFYRDRMQRAARSKVLHEAAALLKANTPPPGSAPPSAGP
jgi:hypothetical protein